MLCLFNTKPEVAIEFLLRATSGPRGSIRLRRTVAKCLSGLTYAWWITYTATVSILSHLATALYRNPFACNTLGSAIFTLKQLLVLALALSHPISCFSLRIDWLRLTIKKYEPQPLLLPLYLVMANRWSTHYCIINSTKTRRYVHCSNEHRCTVHAVDATLRLSIMFNSRTYAKLDKSYREYTQTVIVLSQTKI